MEYLEVKVYTTTKGIDPVSGIFLAAGVEGIVVEDKNDFYELMEKKNSYDWDYVDEGLVEELQNAETWDWIKALLFVLLNTEVYKRRHGNTRRFLKF